MSDHDRAAAVRAHRGADLEALAAALVALPETQRRALHDELRPGALRPGDRRSVDQVHADLLAGVGTCAPGELAWSWYAMPPAGEPASDRLVRLLADVLAARPPRFRQRLVAELGDPASGAVAAWPVVRALGQRGLVADGDASLVVGALRAVSVGGAAIAGGTDAEDHPDDRLVHALDADATLADLVLRGLGLPAALDAAFGTWDVWVRGAVEAGALPRDDVLATVLRTQDRDVRPSTAALLVRVLVGLAPTDEELAAHEAALVRIVADGRPVAARQAGAFVRRLAAAGALADPVAAARATAGPLTGSQKAAAVQAVRLLDDLPLDGATRAAAAVVGLGHPHEEVQRRVLDVVEGVPGPPPVEVRTQCLLHLDTVAPAHRDRVAALAGVAGVTVDDGAQALPDVPTLPELARRVRGVPAPVRAALGLDAVIAAATDGQVPPAAAFAPASVPAGAPVEPVADHAELAELLGFVMGGSATPVDLEQVIDGLARLDPRATPPHVASVVASHAQTSLAQWGETSAGVVGLLVARAATAWLRATPPDDLPWLARTRPASGSMLRRLAGGRRTSSGSGGALLHDLVRPPAAMHDFQARADGGEGLAGLAGVVEARLHEAVVVAVDGPRPTLALPTEAAGWVGTEALLSRVVALDVAGRVPGRLEAVAALRRLRDVDALRDRLPTGGSTDALAAAVAGRPDADPGLRAALAGRGVAPGTVVLPVAPEGDHQRVHPTPRFPLGGAAPAWRRDDPVGQLLDELATEASAHAHAWWDVTRNVLPEAERPLVTWAPTALPGLHHLLAAAMTRSILVDPDADRSSSAVDELLAVAAAPDTPLVAAWPVLLAAALGGGNQVAGIAAADAVAAAAEDGRLDAHELGDQLALLHGRGVARANRVADRLGPVASSSPVLAAAVRRVVQAWVGRVEGLPRDLHHVLGLLEVACDGAGAGVDHAPARVVLTAGAVGRSRRAATASRLLALPGAGPAWEPAAVADGLLARAERWATAHG